jgi:ribosomal protein S12 methylthiotransferase accessory factor
MKDERIAKAGASEEEFMKAPTKAPSRAQRMRPRSSAFSVPEDVAQSFDSPDRVCPIFAGPALIEGEGLQVRLPGRDVTVEAPRRLLRQVFGLCDGTRSIRAILQEAPAASRSVLKRFINDLLRAGVLVDCSLLPVAAMRYGVNGTTFGERVAREVWTQTPQRWHALRQDAEAAVSVAGVRSRLDPLIDKRISTSTFGDGAIGAAALLKWLWTMGGLLREQHENEVPGIARRTIPSGGAIHSVRPVLVLRKAVGEYDAGIYDVVFPAAHKIQLVQVSGDLTKLVRAMAKPSYLMHATGIVFLVSDPRLVAVKYRARAMQYVLLEAGAALQNAGLAAPSLGIATAVFGSYYEDVVSELCRLDDELVLCSLIFGAPPSAKQWKSYRQARDFEFAWAEVPLRNYTMPYYLARTTAVERDGKVLFTWGRDKDPWLAYRKSTGEAIERQGFFAAKDWHVAQFRELAGAVDPRAVVRYSEQQYRQKRFPFRPFTEDTQCSWVPGVNAVTGAKHWLLAELVFARGSLISQAAPVANCGQSNSSGCAAGETWEFALQAAVLELIERDAFMRAWLRQEPGVALQVRSLPLAYRRRISALEATGCDVKLQWLASPWSTVVLASAQNHQLGFTAVGTGARDDALEAIESALVELETYVYIRVHRTHGERLTPPDVRQPQDHALLYAMRAYYRRADRLLQPVRSTSLRALSLGRFSQPDVSVRLHEAGVQVFAADITPSRASLDQGRSSLVVLRAVAPGLIPVCFGYGLEPLGMAERFSPGARFPHPLP